MSTTTRPAQTMGATINEMNVLQKMKANVAGKISMLMINTGLADSPIVKGFSKQEGIIQFMLIMIGFLLFVIFWWGFNKLYLDSANCSNIEAIYKTPTLITDVNLTNPTNQYLLRDYYIKTAYNCCASGKNKNDFVNVCALKNCIKQGVRALDFEIYSVSNKPVIAVSSVTSYNIKESYNMVPFDDAMNVVENYAFAGSNCPNPNDPLILIFRIKSDNKTIYDLMAKSIYNRLENRLLGKKYSYESNGYNLGSIKLSKLMNKVIIIVDKANPLFIDTLLNEYVNMASNTPFMRTLRFNDIKYTPDAEELTNFNKQNMTLALPNISANVENYSPALVQAYGCQFIGMSFQNFDDKMEFYALLFDQAGSAFILKPERLRYVEVIIPAAELAPEQVSLAPRFTNPPGTDGNSNMTIVY